MNPYPLYSRNAHRSRRGVLPRIENDPGSLEEQLVAGDPGEPIRNEGRIVACDPVWRALRRESEL